MNEADFQEIVWQKGRELYRDMPWRDDTNPYCVLVSELMLQQTQVHRVVPKFEQFIAAFPDVVALAEASLGDVLALWSGLGYNRRAKYLHEAAKMVVSDFAGSIPSTYDELLRLPGIGPNTAGAILVYSFNQPAAFIETNVRTVYFHHFFDDSSAVSDAQLKALVAQTIDTEHPREWFWALMDYGAFLKKQGSGRIDKSAHYKKQPPLKGSVREVRGFILKELTHGDVGFEALAALAPQDERFEVAVEALKSEGLIEQTDGRLHLRR